MLTSIEIHNFKAIKDKPLILKGLTNVNYIVGENGSGKSSVLEFVHLKYLEKRNTSPLLKIIYSDEELDQVKNSENEDISHVIGGCILIKPFFNFNFNHTINYSDPKKVDQISLDDLKNIYLNQLHVAYLNTTSLIYNKNKKISGNAEVDDSESINRKVLPKLKQVKDYLKKRVSDLTFESFIDSIPDNKTFEIVDNLDSFKLNNIERISSGRSHIFNLVYTILYSFFALERYGTDKNSYLFIVEEPETNLHASWEKIIPLVLEGLIDCLKEISKIKFLISTHSPFIINSALELDNQKVFHLQKGELVGEVTKKDLNSFNLALDGLGVKPSDMMFANGVVWVEGPTDAIYIEKWLEMYQLENLGSIKYTSGLNYQFQMYGGALLKHYTKETDLKKSITDMLKINTKRFVVFDSDIEDDEDKSTFEKYKNAVMKEIGDENFYWHDTSTMTIENYIPTKLRVGKYKNDKYMHAIRNIQKWEDEKPKLDDFSNLKPQITKLFSAIKSWNS